MVESHVLLIIDVGRPTVSVRGRLGTCINYWEEVLYTPPWVLETLRNAWVCSPILFPAYTLCTAQPAFCPDRG